MADGVREAPRGRLRAGAPARTGRAVIHLHLGDCLAYLRSLPDDSVDSGVVDPPYGLGKPPDAREVMRAWLAD